MKNLVYVVHGILDDYGCSPKYNGTFYLRDSICMFLEGMCEIEGLNAVYTALAEKYKIKIWNIERSIRTLIDNWWKSSRCGGLFQTRPTNGEVICKLTVKIRAKFAEPCCAGSRLSS